MSCALLAEVLRQPEQAAALAPVEWDALLTAARAELLIATLAHRLRTFPVPATVARILSDARRSAEVGRRHALWEAEMARRALSALPGPVILLKGTAYVALGSAAGQGRSIGDLDILVPRPQLAAAEQALLSAGWEWVKEDAYDDHYYRAWMHELPPLIHRDRDRMIDVHHNILPLTARVRPDAAALVADAEPLGNGLYVLNPADRVVHAVAHLFADGDLQGGLRNLWDIHCLLDEADTEAVRQRAGVHGLSHEVARAIRLRTAIFGAGGALSTTDRLFRQRLLARDGWGRLRHPATEFGFFVRSHWLRMPPAMLARHLATKWRKGHRG